MKKNEDVNKIKDDIKELYSHAKTANAEMGDVKTHLGSLTTDVSWMKETVDKVDNRTWYILSGIILLTLLQVAIKIIWK